MFRRLSTGDVIDESFIRFAYPLGYRYDILRGLDYFRAAGGTPDGRTSEALDIVASRRGADGKWLLDDADPDETAFDFGELVGEPSRWVTLRALRVLRWANRPS